MDYTMHAVVKTGGKQYRVAQGETLTVERIEGKAGDTVALEALMVGVKAGGKVEAEIVAQERGDKVIIFKKKRRQNYRRKNGHRQDLTTVKVTSIA